METEVAKKNSIANWVGMYENKMVPFSTPNRDDEAAGQVVDQVVGRELPARSLAPQSEKQRIGEFGRHHLLREQNEKEVGAAFGYLLSSVRCLRCVG